MRLADHLNTCLSSYFSGYDDALAHQNASESDPYYLAGFEEASCPLEQAQTLDQYWI